MNILYARDYSEIDGTYLLMLRLAKAFSCLGHTIYYLHYGNDNAGVLAEISKYATLLSFPELQQRYAKGEAMPAVDVIQPTLGGDRLIEAITVIKGKWFPQAKFIMGIYHPRACVDKTIFGLSADSKMYAAVLRKLGGRNLIFMHDSMVTSHNNYLNLQIAGAPVINLPVEIPSAPRLRPSANRLKMVSIGRLVSFKTYTYKVLPAIKRLRDEGHDLAYSIYGDGPDKERLVEAIRQSGLEQHVHLMGTVAPAQLRPILEDAGVFVGVGTALVQAAGWCVPCLIGMDSNTEETSYGWIANRPDTLGDRIDGLPEYPFYDLLRDYLRLSPEAYTQLCLDCYQSVKENYSLDSIAQQYLQAYKNADARLDFKMNRFSKWALKMRRQLHKPFMDKQFSSK